MTENFWDSFEKAVMKSDATAKFDRCVSSSVDGLVKKFTKDKGRSPNQKEMRGLRSSGFAICTSQLGKKAAKGLYTKAPDHLGTPAPRKKKKKTKKELEEMRKKKSKANFVEMAWEGMAFGDGITDPSGNANHVHSFFLQIKQINDTEWVISGRTESSNDPDFPHNHAIMWRGELEVGIDIVLDTMFADSGPDHVHKYILVWKE